MTLEKETHCSRGFLFILSLALTKSRKSIRKSTIDFLLAAFNGFVRPLGLPSNPFDILKVFYGQLGTADTLAAAGIATVQLTKEEAEIIISNVQNTYVSSLVFMEPFPHQEYLEVELR